MKKNPMFRRERDKKNEKRTYLCIFMSSFLKKFSMFVAPLMNQVKNCCRFPFLLIGRKPDLQNSKKGTWHRAGRGGRGAKKFIGRGFFFSTLPNSGFGFHQESHRTNFNLNLNSVFH